MGLPFQLTNDPEGWSEAYLQYYTYLHYVLDQHINRILQTLKDTGMDKNTIVVFAPDHGDYGASHGMLIEKWHSAYQEAIHVPVVVRLPGSKKYKSINNLTSHIDILPTLVGLSGNDITKLTVTQDKDYSGNQLIGADLSKVITSNNINPKIKYKDGKERKEILFVTDDLITQPINADDSTTWPAGYTAFNGAIDYYKNKGLGNYGGINGHNTKWQEWTQYLKITDGTYGRSVCSPCRIQCVRQDSWKLVRYFEDTNSEVANQWELYNLDDDPNEMSNLLVYNETFPTVYDPKGKLTAVEIKRIKTQAEKLRTLLYQLVSKYNAADGVPT
jgi:arylsulfatase A-like enzyme